MTRRSVYRRVAHGMGANLYGQMVTVAVQLLGVPILLHFWGARLYGEWLILVAVPAYLSMTDLGFSQSAANDMAQQVARGNFEEALAVFQSLGVLVVAAAAIALLVISALLFELPLQRWLNVTDLSTNQVRWVLWFLAAEVLVKLAEGVSHAGLRSEGDYPLHGFLYASVALVQNVAIWSLAVLGAGPSAAAAAVLSVRVVALPSVSWLTIRRHPWLKFGVRHARASELKRLARPAVANLSMPLAQALSVQGMVVLIGAIAGSIAVVTFSTLRTLTRVALQGVLVVTKAAEPELASAYGSADGQLLRDLFVHTLRAGFWLTGAATIGLLLFGDIILRFWTHGRVGMDPGLFHWLLLSAIANGLCYGPLVILQAANRHVRASLLYVLSIAFALVLAGSLLSITGHLSVVGLALSLFDSMMAVYLLGAASRLAGTTVATMLKRASNPLPALRFLVRSARAA